MTMDENNLERAFNAQVFRNRQLVEEKRDLAHRLRSLRLKLDGLIEETDKALMPATGAFVLCRRVAGKWEPVCCLQRDEIPDELPDFEVILPIPDPASLAEFDGL